MHEHDILDSWKAIAAHLNREIRTCQRYERECGLPVHRLEDSPRARVFAYKNEIDAWLANNSWERTGGLRGRFLRRVRSKPLAAIAAASLVFGVCAYLFYHATSGRSAGRSRISIAVLPFFNDTGRSDLDKGSIEIPHFLIQGLSGSKYFQIISDDKTIGVLRELRIKTSDHYVAEDLRRFGTKSGATHTVIGHLFKVGQGLTVMLTIREIKTDQAKSSSFECADEAALVPLSGRMADQIKRDLGLSRTILSGDYDAPAVPVTTSSLEAFRIYNQARRFHLRGDYFQSAKHMRKAIVRDPEFAMAWRSLAVSYQSLGDPVQAEDYFRKALAFSQNASLQEQFFIRSSYFISRAEFANSLQVLREWSSLYPDDPQTLVLAGNAQLREEEADAARQSLLEALRKGDKNPFTFYYAALACAAAGRPDEAEKIVENGLSVHPRNPLIEAAGVTVSISQGRYDQALSRLVDAAGEKPTVGNELRHGDILLLKGDFRGAESHYSKIRPISPRFKSRLAALALAEGRYKRATDLAGEAGNHAMLAYIEWRRGRLSNGLEEAKITIRNWVRSGQTYEPAAGFQLKGTIEAYLGDIEAAKATEAQLRELSRSGSEKNCLRAATYLRGLIACMEGRDEEADKEFSSALDSPYATLPYLEDLPYLLGAPSGSCAIIIDAAAHHREKLGDLSGASVFYQKLIDLCGGRLPYPDLFALAHYGMGHIRQAQADLEGAKRAYAKFLDLWKNADPGLPEVEDAKARLAELR